MRKDLTVSMIAVSSKLEIEGLINHVLRGVLLSTQTDKVLHHEEKKVHFRIGQLIEKR